MLPVKMTEFLICRDKYINLPFNKKRASVILALRVHITFRQRFLKMLTMKIGDINLKCDDIIPMSAHLMQSLYFRSDKESREIKNPPEKEGVLSFVNLVRSQNRRINL
jgi:hypothetical protein